MLGHALARQQFDVTLACYLQTGLTVRAEPRAGRRDPRILRRRDHVVRRAARGGRRRDRRGVGRPARQFRGRRVSRVPAAVQGRRLRDRRRRDRHGRAIGLFGTTINTPDNVLTIVGNNKIFSDTIQNFSANPYRRVDLTVTDQQRRRSPSGDPAARRKGWRQIPNVLATPAPDVDVLQFTPAGPLLCVRPFCGNQPLLAGVLRHQPPDSRILRRSRLSPPMPGYSVSGTVAPPLYQLSH